MQDQTLTEDKIVKYGLKFPAHFNKLDIELHCFKVAHSVEAGGLGKPGHFWRAVALLWGKQNVVGNRTKYFIRNPWSEEMVEEWCTERYIAVGGPASCSKSETYALLLLLEYLADARNVLGCILSTSLKEARKRIWGSLVEFIRAIPEPGLPLKVIDSQGIIRYVSGDYVSSDKASISLVAGERKAEKEAVGKLIGMHNQKVFVIADELSELTPSILEYGMPGGNLTSNPQYKFVGLSNPPGYFDPFALLWKPKAGWVSVTVDDTRWETEHGIGLHFDANKSPNLSYPEGKEPYPFLPTRQKIEDAKKAEGGENSTRYWRMMRGFPSPGGSEELIYAPSDIIKFRGDERPIWNDWPIIRLAALDPGFTNGGDRSIAYFGTLGTMTNGTRALCFDEYMELIEDVTNKKENRTYQICRIFAEQCRKRGVLPQNAGVDATGAGSPFCDVLDVVWSPLFNRVRFGGKASDLPVSLTSPQKGFERYYDRVTEIWYSGKELLRQGQLKGIHPDMALEMTTRLYGTTGAEKKIYAESKADMKLRTKRSPDIADAAFIMLDVARQRHGFGAQKTNQYGRPIQASSWSALRNRLNAPRNLRQSLYDPSYPRK